MSHLITDVKITEETFTRSCKNKIFPFDVSRPLDQKIIIYLKKIRTMSAIIRVPVIFLVSLYSVQMHLFRSSYYKVSSHPDIYTKEDFLLTTIVRDELSCASNCNANTHCQSALFDKDSKKCSLIKAKKPLHRHNSDESGATGKVVLEKVR